MESQKRLRQLAKLLLLIVLCAGMVSCASADKVRAANAKADETNLLATDLKTEQEQMRTELESLRARVEALSNEMRAEDASTAQELKELAQRLDELNSTFEDLSQRQEALHSAVLDLQDIISGLPNKGPEEAQREERKRIFAAARQDYNKGDYSSAIMGFRNYLAAYPTSSAAGDAQYWIGESLFASKQYKKAITEFTRVLEVYPKSDRTAETLLRLGLCHAQLNEPQKAAGFFTEVQRRFPDSNEARLAKAQLEGLK